MKKEFLALGAVSLGLVVWQAWVHWQLREPFPDHKLRDLTVAM